MQLDIVTLKQVLSLSFSLFLCGNFCTAAVGWMINPLALLVCTSIHTVAELLFVMHNTQSEMMKEQE